MLSRQAVAVPLPSPSPPPPRGQGDAILFYSQHPSGLMDPMSQHGGCPVLDGTKWAANLWVRARIARVWLVP
jgi:hypothetical protein